MIFCWALRLIPSMLRRTFRPRPATHAQGPGETTHSLSAVPVLAPDNVLKAVAAYQKLAKAVPWKPATSRLFNCPK